MGTLSENQTQEHNKEENRPGREDLRAGAASKESARERLRGRLRDRKGLWTCWVAAASVPAWEPQAGQARARSLRPRPQPSAEPAGRSRC